MKFHSGDPLTAADVEIFHRTRHRRGVEILAQEKPVDGAGIETPDDKTVVVKLASRSISLPYRSLSYVWIVNDAKTDITATEDGTGPYVLDGWKRGSAISLKALTAIGAKKPKNGGATIGYFTEAAALDNALLTDALDLVTTIQLR